MATKINYAVKPVASNKTPIVKSSNQISETDLDDIINFSEKNDSFYNENLSWYIGEGNSRNGIPMIKNYS
jgi:hypothetical protein